MYKHVSFNVNFTLFISYILTSSTFRSWIGDDDGDDYWLH